MLTGVLFKHAIMRCTVYTTFARISGVPTKRSILKDPYKGDLCMCVSEIEIPNCDLSDELSLLSISGAPAYVAIPIAAIGCDGFLAPVMQPPLNVS
jgi:hypothetical protein